MVKTTLVRIPRELRDTFNRDFPGVNHSNLISLAWKTSPLSLESKLVQLDFKNKMGEFIYGKKVWKR